MPKRGEIWSIAGGPGFGGKPRPAIIIQSDDLALGTVLVLLCTSQIGQVEPLRVHVRPDDENGLREPTDIMVELPTAIRREKIGEYIGTLSGPHLASAEQALLLVLGFGDRDTNENG